jgi:outer membrane protein assembly factor BamB
LLVAVSGIAATYAARFGMDNDTDLVIRRYMVGGVSLILVLMWWLLFSGLRSRTKFAGLFAAVAAGVGFGVTAIRHIAFDGAMRPEIEFAWDPPSARQKAAEWLRSHAPDARSTGIAKSGIETGPSAEDPATLAPASDFHVTAADWPRFAGPNGDRLISEPVEAIDFSRPPRELWRHPVGEAWSSFAVVGHRVFTQEQRGEQECVVCYDADSGAELWRHEDTARYATAQGGVGPRATPTVTDSAVFTLGATGLLNALHPLTGALIWQRNICTDSGANVLEWGMSGSPLVLGERVIVDAGGTSGKAVIAYRAADGEVAWASTSHAAGYAAPRMELIDGHEQLLVFHGDGLAGLNPSSGQLLWEYPWTNQYRINVAQPMRFGNQLLLSSGYDSGCAFIDPTQLTGTRPADVWPPNRNLKLKFNEAVQRGNFVFGLDDGILVCLDVATGERRWKQGRYYYGQVLLWDDKLVIQAEKGPVAIVAAEPDEYRELARFDVLSDRTWNMHVVNRGRLYVRNAVEAACLEFATSTAASP